MTEVITAKKIVLVTEECCTCGVTFGLTADYQHNRRRDTTSFFCPNGHPQHYSVSEADHLRQQIEAEKKKLANAQFELLAAERAVKRLKAKISNGVCPCCHRQFVQMARHMKSKHPDYAP